MKSIEPQRPILGGNVPPQRVVGRDGVIAKMWTLLEDQSVVLVAERRIGKTSVLRKMEAEPREGWKPIYIPLEGKRSRIAFVSALVEAMRPHGSTPGGLFSRLEALFTELSGQQVLNWNLPELRDHWKKLLHRALDDIAEHAGARRFVLLLDEFPIMISNIHTSESEHAAMELLDELRDRRLRETEGKIRWVFTGSIGLHLVISALRTHGYTNDPMNNTATVSLGGLAPEDGQHLALSGMTALLNCGDITVAEDAHSLEIARSITQAADGLPFYINHLVALLQELPQPVSATSVDTALQRLLLAADDPAHLRHYAERLEVYYTFHEQAYDLACTLLGSLSHHVQGLSDSALRQEIAAQMAPPDDKTCWTVLDNLLRDHYLVRADLEGHPRSYRFKYGLIRRWWQLNRAKS